MNPRAWLFPLAAVLLLGGLFLVFKPKPGSAPAPDSAATPAAAPAAVPVGPKVFELRVKNGKLAGGPAVIKVAEGDEVVLRISTDKSDELHLHGYDLHAHLKPGAVAELRFSAKRTGRFEYELHKAHVDLGALEVHPK